MGRAPTLKDRWTEFWGSDVDYRNLGRSGISVSAFCLGTMTWGQQTDERDAHAIMDEALAAGINFLDAAEMYPIPPRAETQGRTEEIVGSWLRRNGQRDKWVIATKITGPGHAFIRGGRPMTGGEVDAALAASLERLGTDYIDLYQLHWPNRPSYNFEKSWDFSPEGHDREEILDNFRDVLGALDGHIKAGRIRAIGVSNETSWGLMRYLGLAETEGLPRVETIQNEYNLLRRHFDLDLAEIACHEQVGLLAYSPLAAGLLTGKYNDGAMPANSRGQFGTFWRLNPDSEAATKAYMALARDHGIDHIHMALAFTHSRPFMASVIFGATTIGQFRHAIEAHALTLAPEILDGIKAIHKRYPRTI